MEKPKVTSFGLINGREFAFTNTSKEFITFDLLDLRCMYEYNTLSYPLSNTIQCINHTVGKVEMVKFNHEVMRTIFNKHRYLKYFCDTFLEIPIYLVIFYLHYLLMLLN